MRSKKHQDNQPKDTPLKVKRASNWKEKSYLFLYLCTFLISFGGTSLLLSSADINAQQLRPKDYVEMEERKEEQSQEADIGSENTMQEIQWYVFIGDSRFNQMRNIVSDTDHVIWITMDGADHTYYWENREAISAIDKSAIVVYEIGVNDLDSEAETEVLEDLVSMGFSKVYFHGSMPADEDMEGFSLYYRTNDSINKFNTEMLARLPEGVTYITPFDIELSTYDGMHYTDECYENWYSALMDYLKGNA